MTYWIIVAMMLVAIVAVVLALGSERSERADQPPLNGETELPIDDDE